MSRTFLGADGKARCRWCAATPEYVAYHDTEWGFPVVDDRRLFEKLSLEGFQSGLSWRTILAKRDNFRAAFREFDFDRVARFGARDVKRLLADAGIVRHRGKIEAVINNAQRARELVKREGSLAAFIWRYEPDKLRKPQTAFDIGRVRSRCRRISRSWAGASSVRPRCMRSCRRWGSSTITSRTA